MDGLGAVSGAAMLWPWALMKNLSASGVVMLSVKYTRHKLLIVAAFARGSEWEMAMAHFLFFEGSGEMISDVGMIL